MLSRIIHSVRGFFGDTVGSTAAELAITAPILVILGLGAAEIGRVVQHHHTVEKSARDAARYLSRVPVTCGGGVTNAADLTTARNLAWTGYPNGTTPLLSYWANPNTTISVTVSCYANTTTPILVRVNSSATAIPLIAVSIDVPYDDMGFLGLLGVAGITLKSSHSQVHIGE